MVKPTREDAQLLLRLHELTTTDAMAKALNWFRFELDPKLATSAAEFQKTYPPGSDGSKHYSSFLTFWEMAGVLVNNGLLHEGLFFDRFLVAPYWEAFQPMIYEMRKEAKEPRLSENFELLYVKEKAWHAKHPPKKKEK